MHLLGSKFSQRTFFSVCGQDSISILDSFLFTPINTFSLSGVGNIMVSLLNSSKSIFYDTAGLQNSDKVEIRSERLDI